MLTLFLQTISFRNKLLPSQEYLHTEERISVASKSYLPDRSISRKTAQESVSRQVRNASLKRAKKTLRELSPPPPSRRIAFYLHLLDLEEGEKPCKTHQSAKHPQIA